MSFVYISNFPQSKILAMYLSEIYIHLKTWYKILNSWAIVYTFWSEDVADPYDQCFLSDTSLLSTNVTNMVVV